MGSHKKQLTIRLYDPLASLFEKVNNQLPQRWVPKALKHCTPDIRDVFPDRPRDDTGYVTHQRSVATWIHGVVSHLSRMRHEAEKDYWRMSSIYEEAICRYIFFNRNRLNDIGDGDLRATGYSVSAPPVGPSLEDCELIEKELGPNATMWSQMIAGFDNIDEIRQVIMTHNSILTSALLIRRARDHDPASEDLVVACRSFLIKTGLDGITDNAMG